jgi:hypothetical protein
MAKKTLKILASLALVAALGLNPACTKTDTKLSSVNENVIASWGFHLDASSVNLTTRTSGTIFAKSSGEKISDRKVVISARVDIDPVDWGGVSFSIPAGWEVSAVTTDYPQGSPDPQNHTSTIYTGSVQEFQRVVEIGNTKHGAAEPQGGTGSVIIELVPMPDNKDIGDSMEIAIALGSAEGNIAGPVNERFKVTFD